MKTNTVLILTAASILLAGSTALAVNSQTVNSPPAGGFVPADTVFLPQSSTTAGTASPVSTPSPTSTPGRSATEDASPGSSPKSIAPVPAGPSLADDGTAALLPAPAPGPSRSIAPNDDHGGHGELEPGDDHGGHGELEPGDDKRSGSDD
ncbi:hypothetical protein QFZ79_003719 [Arthrobacter sp. V4I6]|uniref:hypothetical protein n=1 Tax=unclassified Arthrobacter TaxID=235627 RepID=UPI002787F9E7|nr:MULTISPECIES: hypothetical protein [unclassified Arthrobacter]MDQ0821344.1 hypothetical protein [Arthrobacter sp. V1I7]MDQ0855608.1 hypothetical protein [Arthrobacter sp. V4I6]